MHNIPSRNRSSSGSFIRLLSLRRSYKHITPKFSRARLGSLNTIQVRAKWPTSFDQRPPSRPYRRNVRIFLNRGVSHYIIAERRAIRCLSRCSRGVRRHDFSLNPRLFLTSLALRGPHIEQSGAFRKVWLKCGTARYSWHDHHCRAPSWTPSSP